MYAIDVADAVAMDRQGEKKSRTEEIGQLEPNVVITMTISRHFNDSVVSIPSRGEFLRKDGVREVGVLGLCAAVGNQ